MATQVSGLISGMDTQNIITQLLQLERIPVDKLEEEKIDISDKRTALNNLDTKLLALQTSLKSLDDDELYAGRSTSLKGAPEDPAVSSIAEANTLTGAYKFEVTQLATETKLSGATNIGNRISDSSDVSAITISSMNVSSAVSEGSFTVNGKQVQLETTDSLQDVLDAISTATGGDVTASYNPTTDTLNLSGSSEITLGSSGDTSNFLAVMKLFSNGTNDVSSNSSLGSTTLNTTIDQSHLGTAINTGTFTINGSAITISEGDSMDDIFSNISSATGGDVAASYNASTNKISLSSASPITLGDSADTSNFLAATHLTANATGSVTSEIGLGNIDTSASVTDFHLEKDLTRKFSAGDFTISGNTVSILDTDSLDDIFSKINTASGGDITASYNSDSKTISLNSASEAEITLGDPSDTSNFITLAQLIENETGSITSNGSLGTLDTTEQIQNLSVTGGMMTLNGQNISYNIEEDSLIDIMEKVNQSDANVILNYDSVSDSFTLINENTGSLGVAMEENGGFMLEAMGLQTGSTLTTGLNAEFKVNDGTTLTSNSNTLNSDIHGITGLSVTGLQVGTETVNVAPDTEDATSKLEDFIEKFNDIQSFIKINTGITVGDEGKVKTQKLTGNREVDSLSTELRKSIFSSVSTLSGSVKRLADMGIDFKTGTDELEISDAEALESALKVNASAVTELFTHATDGFTSVLDKIIEGYVKDDGTLDVQKETFDGQIKRIDIQIGDLERYVQFKEEQLQNAFFAMESAQGEMQNQLQYLPR